MTARNCCGHASVSHVSPGGCCIGTCPCPGTNDALEAEWHAAVAAAPPACKCSHPASFHAATTDRCRSAACGCLRWRPREEKARSPQPATAPPPLPAALPELVPCPECNGSGQGLLPDDPDYRWFWCGSCWGVGVVDGTS